MRPVNALIIGTAVLGVLLFAAWLISGMEILHWIGLATLAIPMVLTLAMSTQRGVE
jgi:hypothetical protein